jgi:hypothetical protein
MSAFPPLGPHFGPVGSAASLAGGDSGPDPETTAVIEYAAANGDLYAAMNGDLYAAPEPV